MAFDPLVATGLITVKADGRAEITGTCFLFRHENVALTAAHCVPQEPTTVIVHLPRLNRVETVRAIRRHPDADIAMLVLADEPSEAEGYPDNAFWDRVSNWRLGEEFFAYGFPTEGPAASDEQPIPRLFVGHFQRFFDHQTPRGYRYLAGELSMPAPSGLSGGPVFRSGAPQMLTALVTANHESYAVTDSSEEVREDGAVFRLEARKVITYGLALMLSGVSDWLQAEFPCRVNMGWVS